MAEYWATCEDLARNVEDQLVAFGPFKSRREARVFGWALSYADVGDMTYLTIGVRKGDDIKGRLRVAINPEKVAPASMTSRDWDDLTTWPEGMGADS